MNARTWVLAAALYALAVPVLTWPLFRHPATRVLDTVSLYSDASVLIQRDINLTLWTLAWDTHALVTDPLRLFHANAFHPAPDALAFSEHKLGNLPLFAPVYLATANPVLAHQVALLATFVLAGLAMAAYVRYWTADEPVAIAAGFFYAFAPFRFWQLGSLDYISIHLLPLVLLGIDATLDRRGGAAAPVGLAAAILVSSLCSYYIAYAAFILAGVYLAAGTYVRGRTALARLPPIGLALALPAMCVGGLSVPYLRLQQSGALADYADKAYWSLAFLAILKFGVHGLLGWYVLPRRDGIPEFLTYTALALAVFALVAHRRPPRGALVAVAATGVVLTLGPYLRPRAAHRISLPYRWLALTVPGFSAMRSPQRFGAIVTLAVMALAALGLAELRAALRARGRAGTAAILPALAVALFLVEVTPRGLSALPMKVGPALPPAYSWLAAHGEGGALLELPSGPLNLERQSEFMYYSTYHWLPLVNGYSSYPPRHWQEAMSVAVRLPDPNALATLLEQTRPRWVLFHRADLKLRWRQPYQAALESALRPVETFGDDVLFEVSPASSPGDTGPPSRR